MSLKQNGLRVLRNFLYRSAQKTGRSFRKINRTFLRSITEGQHPVETAPTITNRRTSDDWKHLQPVWVLSTGRTGTQTLTELLNRSPLLEAYHEPAPELFAFSYDYFSGKINWEEALQSLRYLRDELVFRSFRDGFIYIETNNRLVYIADLLLELYPQSKFIGIHRNPYSFIRSGMRRSYYEGHMRDYARIVPGNADAYSEKWERMTSIEKIAWNWKRVNEICLSFLEELSPEKRMLFPSEKLFEADLTLISELFDFVGSSGYHPPAADIKRVLGKKHNAQQRGSFSKPENWSPQQVENVNTIINSIAHQFDYKLLSDNVQESRK